MIPGIYYEQRTPSVEKVPSFYLPNKVQFQSSIGVDFENRLFKNGIIEEEVLILGHFCENVGPVPLIVYPVKHSLSPEMIDMIILKAMSVDYQSCEHGEVLLNHTTQILVLDCSIPFFVHYFTLWDIHARGYVRPCCIVVCCRDKIRARELFVSKCSSIINLLQSSVNDNICKFYQELQISKEMIDKMVLLKTSNLYDCKEIDFKYCLHLQKEYSSLISKIESQMGNCESIKKTKSFDLLLDVSLATNTVNRELRSIYLIMNKSDKDFFNLLFSIGKLFRETNVPESFSLADHESYKEAYFYSDIPDSNTKLSMEYFSTGFSLDRQITNSGKGISPCLCKSLLNSVFSTDKIEYFGDLQKDSLFPNLVNIKVSQCYLVSHQFKQITIPIATRLLSCLFNQCHLIIFVNNQQTYLNLMNVIRLFLPRQYNLNYFVCKPNWPTLSQIKETPVLFVNKDTKSPEMPANLREIVAVYDYTTNHFLAGPKYTKGHLTNFLESFKYLEFNHMHLEPIVNIMLLNYVDMIYQWTSLLSQRDRRWIWEDYLIKLGYTPEDVAISEKLALFVLQTLAKSRTTSTNFNSFLLSDSLFNVSISKEFK